MGWGTKMAVNEKFGGLVPELIDDWIFDINENLNLNVIERPWGNYIEVDNFWKYPEKIHEVSLRMPCIRLHGMYDVQENGQDYFDGRSYHYFAKPLVWHDALCDIVKKVYNVNDVINQDLMLGNNIFTWNEKCYNENKNMGYSPHIDGYDIIACLWYMNPEDLYTEEDGTGIYAGGTIYKKQSPWIYNDKMVDKLSAKYNRLVIYDGGVHHAALVGPKWIGRVRHSMVHFLNYK